MKKKSNFSFCLICIFMVIGALLAKEIQISMGLDPATNQANEQLESGRNLALEIAESSKNIFNETEPTYEEVDGKFDYGMFKITSYYDENSTNTNIGEGIASSNKFIIGTQLYIEGLGTFTVTENDMTTPFDTIKIMLGNQEQCEQFGNKEARVYVIK